MQFLRYFFLSALLCVLCLLSCYSGERIDANNEPLMLDSLPLKLGAERFDLFLPKIKNKRVGLVVNHTSMIGSVHLIDTLIALDCQVKKIFAPEHGLRGEADAGESIMDGKDARTGISVISLYGSQKKPSPEMLQDLDLMIFDIQDVGVRFYTYTSTMTYVMEACAEQNIPFMVLDRPNPNGSYVDGPVLEEDCRSFVGLHPVPIVHGLTVGEYASMINGEGWLKDKVRCDLQVIACQGYRHDMTYELPIPPSPNLPNLLSIYLYPSLCLFEGTKTSVGRGTNKQFQIYGHPQFRTGSFEFVPSPQKGAQHPKHEGKICKGFDLSQQDPQVCLSKASLQLCFLLNLYKSLDPIDKEDFFLSNNFFDKLAGNKNLRLQIKNGNTEEQIRNSWSEKLNIYRSIRKKYLIYK